MSQKAIKVHEDTWVQFNREADKRGLSQNDFLRQLLRFCGGVQIGDLIDPSDDTLLCRYQIYVNHPMIADGTIRRVSRRPLDEIIPPADPNPQDPYGS